MWVLFPARHQNSDVTLGKSLDLSLSASPLVK